MKLFAPFYQRPGQNLLINGNFDIWQRGTIDVTSGDVANVFLLADRWGKTIIANGMAMPVTYTQERVTTTPGSIPQSQYGYQVTSDTARTPNANTHHFIEQRIENGTRRFGGVGRTLTLTFWALPVGGVNLRIGVALRQNYGTGGSADEIIPGSSILITAGAWRKYQYTFTLNTLAGKTLNADNHLALIIGFMWGTDVGGTYYNTAVAEPIQIAAKAIVQIKLEDGQAATPFEAKSPGDELIACQRYFRRYNDGVTYARIANGFCLNATTALLTMPIAPRMYAVPVMMQVGNLAIYCAAAIIATTGVVITATATTRNVIGLNVTVAAGLTAGQGVLLVANNDTTGDIWLNAEV